MGGVRITVKPRRKARAVEEIAEELRVYANGMRRRAVNNATELLTADKELRDALRGAIGGVSRTVVTHPMRASAEHQKRVAGQTAAMWLAFMREYVPESFGRVAVRHGRSRRTGGMR